MSARLREALKSAAIVLLLLLFVYLSAATWLYNFSALPASVRAAAAHVAGIFGIDTGELTLTVEGSRAETYGEAVRPVACAVTWENGRAAVYGSSGEEARRFYARLAPLIGEAVGSAGQLEATSRGQWREALGGTGIYFGMSGSEPFSLLALCLGVSHGSDELVSGILLVPEDEGVRVYAESDAGVWSAATSASSETLAGIIWEFQTGDASKNWQTDCLFSFERGLQGELLLGGGTPEYPTVTASAPAVGEAAFGQLLSAFGINPLTNYRYTSADGSRRAVDGSRSLELKPDGTLIYRDADAENGHGMEFDAADDARLIESARRIAAATAGAFSGDAAVLLRAYAVDGEAAEVSFGYEAAGAPVYIGGDDAAVTFRVEQGTLVHAEIRLRRYTVNADTCELMPEKRVQTLSGGACAIGYYDGGDGAVEPSWSAGEAQTARRVSGR